MRTLLIMFLLFATVRITAQVAINSTGNNPDSSAALDIDFNDRGILIPRLTTAERNNIPNPKNSLLIFNKTTNCFEVFLDSQWRNVWCKHCSTCVACSEPPTNVSIMLYPNPPCNNQHLTLMAVATGASVFQWQGPNGFTANTQNVVIENFSSINEGVYTLTAINECGSKSVSQSIYIGSSVPSNVVATVNPINVCLGDTINFSSTGGQGATYWYWNGPNNFTSYTPSFSITTATENHSGVYTLTASNHCGQKMASTQPVNVQDCPAKCMVIGGLLDDGANSIIATQDNHLLIVGQTNSFSQNGDNDIYLVKLDSDLKIKWKKVIGSSSLDVGYALYENNQGEILVAGITENNTAGMSDILLMKLDANGNIIWSKTVGGPGNEIYLGLSFTSLIKTVDNHYAHLSLTMSYGSGLYDGYLIKFTENGSILFSKAIGRNYYDYLHSFLQLSNGDYLLGGNIWILGSGVQDDIYLVRLNSSGSLIWAKRFFASQREIAFKIILTSDNGFAIVGYTSSFGAGNRDVLLVKLDASGSIQWAKSYGLNDMEEGRGILETPDGGFLLVGYTKSAGSGGEDALVIKTSSNGTLEWARTIGGQNDERAGSLVRLGNEYVILGTSNSYYSQYDILVARINLLGESCCARNVNLTESTGSFTEASITTSVIDGGIVSQPVFNQTTGGNKKRICN